MRQEKNSRPWLLSMQERSILRVLCCDIGANEEIALWNKEGRIFKEVFSDATLQQLIMDAQDIAKSDEAAKAVYRKYEVLW